MNGRILVTDHPFDFGFEPELEVLEPLGVELTLADSTDPERLAELARGVDGILVCFAQVPAAVLDVAAEGGCRIVSRYGIGFDNVDLAAATRGGIVVTTVPDYCLGEVADHTLALLLAAARGIDDTSAGVRAGEWELPRRPVHRLAGRRLALIGSGAIGRRVADRARAFGLEIVVYDPYADRSLVPDVQWADTVEEAVADAHFISLHAPLTDDTRHIVGAATLAAARQAPILVNTARGGLVDLDAVAAALDDGTLTAAALAVTDPEPLPADHPFRHDPRVLVTAHSAYHSKEAGRELQRRAAEEVARVLRGEDPQNPRNPDVLAILRERGNGAS